jgi:hypothetical protein
MPSKDKTIKATENLVAKVLSVATFNSDGTEFYAKYRVGKAQRRICTEVLSEYTQGYRARIRNHGHSCFLCEIVIRSQFHTTYEPEA